MSRDTQVHSFSRGCNSRLIYFITARLFANTHQVVTRSVMTRASRDATKERGFSSVRFSAMTTRVSVSLIIEQRVLILLRKAIQLPANSALSQTRKGMCSSKGRSHPTIGAGFQGGNRAH
jgi:hypothetical protein